VGILYLSFGHLQLSVGKLQLFPLLLFDQRHRWMYLNYNFTHLSYNCMKFVPVIWKVGSFVFYTEMLVIFLA